MPTCYGSIDFRNGIIFYLSVKAHFLGYSIKSINTTFISTPDVVAGRIFPLGKLTWTYCGKLINNSCTEANFGLIYIAFMRNGFFKYLKWINVTSRNRKLNLSALNAHLPQIYLIC